MYGAHTISALGAMSQFMRSNQDMTIAGVVLTNLVTQ